MKNFNLQQWQDCIRSIVRSPRARIDAPPVMDAQFLAQGMTSDIWTLGENHIVKIYRLAKIAVRRMMSEEWDIYKTLASRKTPSPLPGLHHREILELGEEGGRPCGYAVFDRVHGQPGTFDALESMPSAARSRWADRAVSEVIAFEKALAEIINPLSFWDKNYADSRIGAIQHHIPDVTPADREIAADLAQVIATNTDVGRRRFIYADLNPPNIIDTGKKVCLVDPLINLDVPEAYWRHLTFIPGLAQECAAVYDKKTGHQSNAMLIMSLGALTHHFTCVLLNAKDTKEAQRRVHARNACLDELGLR
jgi:hypothetical protein